MQQRLPDNIHTTAKRQQPKGLEVIKQESSDSSNLKKTNWREEREKFITAVRIGKQIDKLEKEGDANNDVVVQSKIRELANQIPGQQLQKDMIQCPTCNRTFNKNAAERHIPRCADIINKPKPPPTKAEVDQRRNQRLLQRSPMK